MGASRKEIKHLEDTEKRIRINRIENSVLLPESFGTVQTGIASTNALLSAKLAVVLLYLAPSAPAFRGILQRPHPCPVSQRFKTFCRGDDVVRVVYYRKCFEFESNTLFG